MSGDLFDYPLSQEGEDLSFDSATDNTSFASYGTGPAESVQTISPEQLFMADPSPAFTNLTTPDMGPGSTFFSPLDSSPFLDNGGLDPSATWPSLFADADSFVDQTVEAPPMHRNVSANTIASSGSSNGSPLVLNASNRRKNSSPIGQSMSASAGVGQRRRRTKPLMDIEVDPADAKAVKRARNTLAARDSRARKMNHIDTLEAKVKRSEAIMQRMQDELRARGYNGDLLEDVEDM